MNDPRRQTPRMDAVLGDARIRDASARLGESRVRAAIVLAVDRCRRGEIVPEDVPAVALASLPATATTMRRVVNATGVIVHTNLGRAPLSDAAVEAMSVASGATDVELDLETGRRGRRGRTALGALADAVPDAESVHVVNNGAAALGLAAAALGGEHGIVVARGELVEIGDGFRLPELIESFGATLREVGTTNRVVLADYEAASEGAAFILKVHPSNFVVSGFTSRVPVRDLATLGLPVVVDIGSGLLQPHPRLVDEPDAASALRAGADLVTASGDKLLGGPQCGLIMGRAELVERLRRHPLARALRVDKTTLAALEATIAGPPSRVAQALSTTPEGLLRRAEALAAVLPDRLGAVAVRTQAVVGGGGAPGVHLESAAVALPDHLARPLRTAQVPVMGHVRQGRLLLDLIAVDPGEDAAIAESVTLVSREIRA